MAKKTKIRKAEDIAAELGEVRAASAELKNRDTKLRTELLAALQNEGLTSAGKYQLTKVHTFKISVEELALQFAMERGLTKVDTAKVKQVFQLDSTLRFADPTKYGFEVVETVKIDPLSKGVQEEE
jgi:hypothetical protein